MARYISVTSASATRSGVNVTYSITFSLTDDEYYIQLRTADGRTTSAAGYYTKTVTDTVTRTVNSPGAGSATQSADYYYQAEQGGSMAYSESLSYTVSWSAMQLTVTFNPGQGTTPTPSKTVTYGATYGTLPVPVRSGYAFVGWFTDPDAGTEVKDTDTVSITADTTLHAHWEAMSILHVAEGGETKTVTNIQTVEGGTVRKVIGVYSVQDGVVRQGI